MKGVGNGRTTAPLTDQDNGQLTVLDEVNQFSQLTRVRWSHLWGLVDWQRLFINHRVVHVLRQANKGSSLFGPLTGFKGVGHRFRNVIGILDFSAVPSNWRHNFSRRGTLVGQPVQVLPLHLTTDC